VRGGKCAVRHLHHAQVAVLENAIDEFAFLEDGLDKGTTVKLAVLELV
jgi:hypothetical protein